MLGGGGAIRRTPDLLGTDFTVGPVRPSELQGTGSHGLTALFILIPVLSLVV